MITVMDLLQLPVTEKFSVVAGGNGLNRTIQGIEILDFEFTEGVQQMRETAFSPRSIVLSSLLFANKKPKILIETIKKLIEMEVTALAYKPVIFRELPNEVLVFANEQHFPILRFGGDEFFEEIIFDVKEYINKKNHSLFLANIMKSLLREEVSEEQLQSFLRQMNQPFDQYVFVANIQMKQSEGSRWMQTFLQLNSFSKSGLICPYKQSIFILYTDNSQQQVEKILKEWLRSYTPATDALTIGYSQIHQTKKELHLNIHAKYLDK